MTYRYLFPLILRLHELSIAHLSNFKAGLQSCILDIGQWMVVNKLKLNDPNTDFVVVAASGNNQRSLPVDLQKQ